MTSKEAEIIFKKHRVIILGGDDISARQLALAALVKVATSDGDYDLAVCCADDAPYERWISDVQTIPFLSEFRTIVVRQLSRVEVPKSPNISDVPASGRLILVIDEETGEPDRIERLKRQGEAWIKSLEKFGAFTLKSILPKKDADIAVVARAEHIGFKITRSAARLLLEIVGNDVNQAYFELPMLGLIAKPGHAITEKDIEGSIEPSPEYSSYRLAEFILMKRTTEAVRQLRSMFRRNPKHATEIFARILPNLATDLLSVWQARCVQDLKGSLTSPSPELSACLLQEKSLAKVADWKRNKLFDYARTNPLSRLHKCLILLGECEAKLKGSMASSSVLDSMEIMVVAMCRA